TTLSSMSPAPTEIYTLSLHDALPICKLPELGAMLKEKLHVFDRPLMLWQELQSMLGGPDTLTTLHLPKIDWVQPTLEFLSPTFRSEEHTSELQSPYDLVCRLLLEKKK